MFKDNVWYDARTEAVEYIAFGKYNKICYRTNNPIKLEMYPRNMKKIKESLEWNINYI